MSKGPSFVRDREKFEIEGPPCPNRVKFPNLVIMTMAKLNFCDTGNQQC